MYSGPMLWDVSGAHVVASIHINSPGPQALSINQVRRPYQYTWSACRVKSPGPQALLIHQVRRPYRSTRFKGLINSQGPQALSLHQVRRPYHSTRSAGLINSTGPQALSIQTQNLTFARTTSPRQDSGTCSGPISQKHPPRDRITGRGRRPKHRRHDTSNHPILAFFRKVMAGVISPCMHSTHDRNIEGTTHQIIRYWHSLDKSNGNSNQESG